HGRWDRVGAALDRAARGVFRLSRLSSDGTTTAEPAPRPGPGGRYPVARIAATDGGDPRTSPAVLRVRVGAGHLLRRRATSISSLADQWDRVDLDHGPLGTFAAEVASHGADVVVEEPVELREAVLERLRAVAAGHEEVAR